MSNIRNVKSQISLDEINSNENSNDRETRYKPTEADLQEFAIYSGIHNPNGYKPTYLDSVINSSGKLQLNTYQAFIKDLFNPESDKDSILLIHGTGTGKTITSLSVATEYQKQFKEHKYMTGHEAYDGIGNIAIIGFTKEIFKGELIRHKEFNFITQKELKEIGTLNRILNKTDAIEERILYILNRASRRITNRRQGGIYTFYGYRQLFLRVVNQEDLTKRIDKLSLKSNKQVSLDSAPVSVIRKWIIEGRVRLNIEFIESFRNSLMICDEIHNAYYQNDVNTYGLAIEIIKDYFKIPNLYNKKWTHGDNNRLRLMMLSATPLSSTPLEIIPIINLLSSGNEGDTKIQASDLFDGVNSTKPNKTNYGNLTSKGESLITQRLQGRISYVMDDNPLQYPSASFEGVDISGIKYLKFIQCRMGDKFYKAYNEYTKSNVDDQDEIVDETLIDSDRNSNNTLRDAIWISSKDKVLYRYQSLLSDIAEPNSKYKKQTNGLLTSSLFKLDSLNEISPKYFNLMQTIFSLLSSDHGKIFVYHPNVVSSGTNLITSIFNENGLIEYGTYPTPNSL